MYCAMRGHFLRATSAISTCMSPSPFARCSNARNGGGITFGTLPDDQDLEISQLAWARDLSRVSFIAREGRFSGRPVAPGAPGHRPRQSRARWPLLRPIASSACCDVFRLPTWQVRLRLAAVDNALGFADG